MGNIVGIDLGTTNSVAAFKLAVVEVVTASDNAPPERKLTRSVVSSTPQALVVGEEAYRQLKAQPENVILSIKRLMGRSFSDSIVQQQLQHLSYRVTQSSQGTEVLVTVELDEKNNSLVIMAALKNNPSIRVSSSFSRGGIDEEISRQVATTIEELNQKGGLNRFSLETAYKKAGEVVRAANQIKNEDGTNRQDRLKVAQDKLKEFKLFGSDDAALAQYYVWSFEFTITHCQFLLLDSQAKKLEQISAELKQGLANHNFSAIEKLVEDAKREMQNLPELVKCLLAASEAIFRADQINPERARDMSVKFSRLMSAVQQRKSLEIDWLWNQLLPDVRQYFDTPLPKLI